MSNKHSRLGHWPWWRTWHCNICKHQELAHKWVCQCHKQINHCEIHAVDPKVHITTKRWADMRMMTPTPSSARKSRHGEPPMVINRPAKLRKMVYNTLPVVHTHHRDLKKGRKELFFDPEKFPRLAAKFNKRLEVGENSAFTSTPDGAMGESGNVST